MEVKPKRQKWNLIKNKDKLYRCDLCPYVTKHRQSFYRHEKNHVKSKYPCRVCNMPYNCQWGLKRHMEKEHGTGEKTEVRLLNCDMCSFSSEDKEAFIRHTKRHNETGVIHCKYCNNPFLSQVQRKIHVRPVHKIKFQNHQLKNNKKATTDRELLHDERISEESHSRIINHVVDRTNFEEPFDDSQVAETVNESCHTDAELEETTGTGNSPSKRLGNDLLNCAFCDHVSKSYAELKAHLDVHDGELDTLHTGYEDGLFGSMESVHGKQIAQVENFDNLEENPTENFVSLEENPTENFVNLGGNATENLVILRENSTENFADLAENRSNDINSKNGGNCHLETTKVGNEMYIATKYTGGQDEVNMTGTAHVEDSTEETMSVEGRDFKDAMDIYEQCMSKLSKNVDDEFMMKPFACAKCFYTTGNIDHLKIHVEAHLYERAKAAYNITHRVSDGTHVGDMTNRETECERYADKNDLCTSAEDSVCVCYKRNLTRRVQCNL